MSRRPLLAISTAAAAAAPLLLPPAAAAHTGAPPAGGAPLAEVIIATAAAAVVLAGLIAVGLARRSGRAGFIAPLENLASRSLGLPGWAALPVSIATGALVAAVFGLYWDISLHIDDGRDEGPLANPAHYFILGGLLGIFAAGWLAVVLPRERPGPAALRIAPGWHAPAGGLVMMACASFAALGFPLDDLWHRLFGQDVTLWGPTHLMMLTGAAMSLVGIFILLVEGRLASGRGPGGSSLASRGPLSFFASRRLQYVLAGGGLLAGLSIYQGEFDFGVPQFRLLYQPVLITLAGSVALVSARLLAGPGGAIGAVCFFLALRGAITVLVGPVFGQSVPHFPTYLAAALLVEAIAWRMGTERSYRFAAVAGAAVGTVGLLVEWAWTHVWMPLPWPAHALGEALALSAVVGVAGAVLGAFLAGTLRLRAGAGARRPLLAAATSVVVVAVALGYLLPTNVPERASARVSLTEAHAAPERWVHATVRLRPPGIADGADWLQGMAWQGRDRVIVAPLREVADDVYRTSEPLPAGGSWKSAIRLHRGRTMGTLPVYAPQDAAIPAPEIPAPAAFERGFQPDRELLQRERRTDVPGWAWTAGSLTVLFLGLALLALLGWALRRLAVSAPASGRAASLRGLDPPAARLNGEGPDPADVHVAIIGSGFSGLAMAIRLKQAGVEDLVVLERAGEVGGTWRDNTYPGCQCDVPSHLYSLSFALNPNWSRTYSVQEEIQRYLCDCADRFGIRPHIRFHHEVLEAAWDNECELWRLRTSHGDLAARFVVAAPGGLSEPSVPDIPGLESFQGTIFHSARWDHDHDLTGERVAVIGTGASAIQFVPQIQPHLARLHLFQRTPPWVMPHTDRPVTRFERALYRALPFTQRLVRAAIYWSRETFVLGFAKDRRLLRIGERIALHHLRRQVPDRELRRKLRPSYSLGCKRVLLSNDYYPALTKPNVEVVTDRIREVRPTSILAEDGTEREVDTIILGTGFHVTDMPAAHGIRGRNGATLAEMWRGSPQAYLGTTIAGLPNAFMLVGPNTGLGHNSIVFMAEAQVSYVIDCLRVMAERGAEVFEVREEAQQGFNSKIQSQMDGTVWMSGGCESWYIDETGRNTTLWPDFTWRFRRRTRRFDPEAYELRRRHVRTVERTEVSA